MKKLNVVIYGCGVMGSMVAEAISVRDSFRLVGALDADKKLIGKDIGEKFKNPKKTGVIITDNPEKLFSEKEVHAAVITTTSHLKSIYSQLTQCIDSGINVISTCEELSYPWKNNEILRELRNKDILEGNCGECKYRYYCGGCRARAYGYTGNYLASDPGCIKNSKKF